jgi:transposase
VNAAVHAGQDSVKLLKEVLDTFGVSLVFLPAYSPELNPCELVFSLFKGILRRTNPNDIPNIRERVLWALSKITFEQVVAWYGHCIFPKNILPDLKLPPPLAEI